jgi:hypothetical protein
VFPARTLAQAVPQQFSKVSLVESAQFSSVRRTSQNVFIRSQETATDPSSIKSFIRSAERKYTPVIRTASLGFERKIACRCLFVSTSTRVRAKSRRKNSAVAENEKQSLILRSSRRVLEYSEVRVREGNCDD